MSLQNTVMKITLNGAARQTDAKTIAELLRELQFEPTSLAVAANESVVRRADFATHVLQAGDSIEIIRAVQGG